MTRRGRVVAGLAVVGGVLVVRAWLHMDLDARLGAPRTTLGFLWAGVALALPWVATRLAPGGPWRRRGRPVLAVALLALGAFTVASETGHYVRHLGQGPEQMKTWRVFHYYLGSKYFPELGYDGLYVEAIKADRQGNRRFDDLERYRDMGDYRHVPIDPIRDAPRSPRWTDARWEAFRADVDHFTRLESDAFWALGPLLDRGYNPAPLWTAVGGLFTRRLPIQEPWAQALMVSLDLALFALAFGVSLRAFGLTRSVLVLSAIFLWFGCRRTLLGGVWFVDWLAAAWLAASLLSLGRFAGAGALVAWAASVRVFPLALFFGPGLAALVDLFRRRDLRHPGWRFAAGGLVGLAALVVFAGLLNGRGFGAFAEFAESLRVHFAHHGSGQRRVGLGHLMAMDWGSLLGGTLEPGWGHLRDNQTGFRVAQLVSVAALAWVVARKPPLDAMLLSIPIVFVGTVASRYYGALIPLMMLLPGLDPARGPRAGALLAWFFASMGLVRAVELRTDAQLTYVLGNLLVAVWIVLVVANAWPARGNVVAAAAPRTAGVDG